MVITAMSAGRRQYTSTKQPTPCRQRCDENEERLFVRVIHPSIQEGVDAGRAESNDATQQADKFPVAAWNEIGMELEEHVDDVKWSPCDGEDTDHGNDHLVGPFSTSFAAGFDRCNHGCGHRVTG